MGIWDVDNPRPCPFFPETGGENLLEACSDVCISDSERFSFCGLGLGRPLATGLMGILVGDSKGLIGGILFGVDGLIGILDGVGIRGLELNF